MERSGEIEIIKTVWEPGVLIGTAILLTLLNLAGYAWKRNPAYSFGVLWFLLMMFPVSGIIVPVAGIIYEHYLYAPMIGLSYIIGLAICDLYKKYKNLTYRVTIIMICTSASIVLVTLTINQNLKWRDAITFYSHTLKYVPKNFAMLTNLGISYAEIGDTKRAEDIYLSALSLNNYSPMAHHNLGNIYYQTGRLNQAIKEYRQAIQLSPTSIIPYKMLYKLYLYMGKEMEANQVMRDWRLRSINR
jgi:Flp pilus assembly protein TadD